MRFFGKKEREEVGEKGFDFDEIFKNVLSSTSKDREVNFIGIFTSTKHLLGVTVVKNFGLVYAISEAVTGKKEVDSVAENLIAEVREKAISMGANAVIGFRFETGTYEESPGYPHTYIIAYGNAVRLEPKEEEKEDTTQREILEELKKLNSGVSALIARIDVQKEEIRKLREAKEKEDSL